MSSSPLQPRLATGDWVRLVGARPSLRGVGKLVEGAYDEVTGALRAACVDLGAGERWIAARDLVRVDAAEEGHLCEVARARGLWPAGSATADRLARALEAFRAGARSFVRTPGLLDLLWNLSTFADPDHGSAGVSDLLLEASAHLAPPPPAPEPEARPEVEVLSARRARERPISITVSAPTVAPPLRLPPPPPPPLARPEQVLLMALEHLNRRARRRLAADLDVTAPRRCRAVDLARAGADLAVVLDLLDEQALATVHADAGLDDAAWRDRAVRRERLLALAGHPAAPASGRAVVILWRLLEVLGGVARASVAEALDVPLAPPRVLAERLVASGASIGDVVSTLTLGEVRFACARLGLTDAGDRDERSAREWLAGTT